MSNTTVSGTANNQHVAVRRLSEAWEFTRAAMKQLINGFLVSLQTTSGITFPRLMYAPLVFWCAPQFMSSWLAICSGCVRLCAGALETIFLAFGI